MTEKQKKGCSCGPGIVTFLGLFLAFVAIVPDYAQWINSSFREHRERPSFEPKFPQENGLGAEIGATVEESSDVIRSSNLPVSPNSPEAGSQLSENGSSVKSPSVPALTQQDDLEGFSEQGIVLPEEYTQIKSLLVRREWRLADVETSKLLVEKGRQAVDRYVNGEIQSERDFSLEEMNLSDKGSIKLQQEVKGFLYPVAARLISCDVYSQLDFLWSNSSGGHFGFSMQRNSWVQAGGNSEDSFIKSVASTFVDVSNVLGWKTRGLVSRELRSQEYIYNLDAPVGHLPSHRRVFRVPDEIPLLEKPVGNTNSGSTSILLRLDECNI